MTSKVIRKLKLENYQALIIRYKPGLEYSEILKIGVPDVFLHLNLYIKINTPLTGSLVHKVTKTKFIIIIFDNGFTPELLNFLNKLDNILIGPYMDRLFVKKLTCNLTKFYGHQRSSFVNCKRTAIKKR